MRTVSTLVGIGLGIVALLVLLWSRVASRASETHAPETPPEAQGARPRASAEPATPGSTVEVDEAPALDPAGSVREAVATSLSSGSTCCIRVVEASSGAPVPAARVWLQSEDVSFDDPAWKRAMRRFNDVEPVLASGLGRELALDARGEVRVPRPERELLLAAAHGTLHGQATMRPADAECVVELERYHALSIEVVDRADRAVQGAHVKLLWGAFDPLDHEFTWVTDEDGRVWIPKLENNLWPEGYRGPVRVTLAGGVQCEPEIVLFDTDTVPADPVRLVAGDHGSVEIQVVDARGAELSLDGTAYVEIDWYLLTDPAFSEPSLALRGGATLDLPLESGRALFETVGLHLPLSVGFYAADREFVSREALGPTTPGQTVHVPIAAGARKLVLRGRVRGMPSAWSTGPTPGAFVGGRAEGVSSADPRLGLRFSTWVREGELFEHPAQGEPSKELETAWFLELSRPGEAQLRASVVPALREDSSVLDFGEIVFEPQPVLASLRVVDDGGAAVAGAAVEIRLANGEKTLTSDESGCCVLGGQPSELPAVAQAFHDDWLPSKEARIEVPGAERTLSLQRSAALEGRLLLPRGLSLEDVDLWLRVSDRTTFVAHLVEGGRFRFRACEPGLATLTVSALGHTVERTGIELVAGRTAVLEPIDLCPELTRFELGFALEDGSQWTGGHLELREPDGELSTWWTIGPSARVLLFAPRPSIDLWVGARGASPKLFEGVVDGDRLALPRAPSLLLRVSSDVRLPGAPFELLVRGKRVQPEDVPFEADDDLDVEPAVLRADRTAWLQVPWSGEYELSWFLRNAVTDVELEIARFPAQSIQVPDAPAIPVVEAELTSAEIAAALPEGAEAWR